MKLGLRLFGGDYNHLKTTNHHSRYNYKVRIFPSLIRNKGSNQFGSPLAVWGVTSLHGETSIPVAKIVKKNSVHNRNRIELDREIYCTYQEKCKNCARVVDKHHCGMKHASFFFFQKYILGLPGSLKEFISFSQFIVIFLGQFCKHIINWYVATFCSGN